MGSDFVWDPLTWAILEQDMQKAFETKAKFGANRKAEVKEAHGGFVSQVVFVTFDWEEGDVENLPKKSVIKVTTSKELTKITEATLDKKFETGESNLMLDVGAMISNNELNFYARQAKWDFDDVAIPKFYCGRKAGDGVAAGYIALEWIEQIEAQYLYDCAGEAGFLDILRTAAKFHAKSIKNPEILNEIPENVPKKLSARFISAAGVSSNLDKIVEKEPSRGAQMEILKKFTELYDQRDKIQKLRKDTCPIEVLCHGDLTQANVLWERVDDRLRMKTLHDWQMNHPGNPLIDLSRLFALCLAPGFLKEKRNEYLEIYFDELKQNAQPAQIPWETTKKLIESFERIFPLETVSVCGLLVPFIPLMLRTCPEEEKAETEARMMRKVYGAIDLCEEFIKKWHQ